MSEKAIENRERMTGVGVGGGGGVFFFILLHVHVHWTPVADHIGNGSKRGYNCITLH